MSKIIGIDLGTTNSVVAVMEGGDPVGIANEEGTRTTPSVVTLTDDSEWHVGQIAKRQAITNPQQTVFSIKRFMGRKLSELEEEIQLVPYETTADEHGNARITIKGKQHAPEEISAKILAKLKKAAEAYLGQPVTDAVITVPAYFNDSQRHATKDAGKIAGLNVKRIVNEPTAAAMAYGLDKKKDETIAIYDFGGGTFDISILEVGENVVEVKATNGNTHLGGDNIDQLIISWLVEEFKKEQGIDLSKDPMALQRLKEAAERAKIDLSSMQETAINLPFVTADASGPKHLNVKLTLSKFEQMIEPSVTATFEPVKQALKDAGLKAQEIDEVILVGGSTRTPLVQKKVEEFFGKAPNRTVNPDEVVAIGAAVQAGVLAGDVKDLLLLDVTPLSLGIETLGSVMTPLVERNTTIPIKKSQTFSTADDGQSSVEVHVLQGERSMASDNRTLGRFHLQGIPPAPRGVPQIEVTFDIDANGIVHVHAKDMATGKENKIMIDRDSSTGLSKEDVDRLVKESEAHASEDKEKQENVKAKNQLDSVLYSTEKLLKEHKDKLGEEDVKALEAALEEGKKALEGDDSEAMNKAAEAIQQASFKLSEILYKQTGDAANANGGAEAQNPEASGANGSGTNGSADEEKADDEGDVIDAEFEEAEK